MQEAKYQWTYHDATNEQQNLVIEYLAAHHLNGDLAPFLNRYHFNTADDISAFLHPNLEHLYDPFLLKDMQKTIERIHQAIENGEQILIYGDYDCDGITSATVMKEAIETLGGEPIVYLPDRFIDGYGPNLDVYKYFIEQQNIQLIITVDNGVAGFEALAYAKEQNVDVIVTDHHELQAELPGAYTIIHPRLVDSDYPFGDLAGVGVAFKVATALLGYLPTELLDLVAIGTIADLVSLTDENRILVYHGLQIMKQTDRIGLQLLAKKAKCQLANITSQDIAFNIAPRLNALGRLENALPGVELLSTFDDLEAQEIVNKIEALNNQRKEIVQTIMNEASQQIDYQKDFNIVYGSNWHEGVLGIVASKIVELTQRPALVLSYNKEKQILKGSGRSIEAVNLAQVLQNCEDDLMTFGGHHMAVGLSLEFESLQPFKQKLAMQIQQQLATAISLKAKIAIDAKLKSEQINVQLIQDLQILEPFGTDNPVPIVEIMEPNFAKATMIGQAKNHLKATFKDNNQLDLLAFNFNQSIRTLYSSPKIQIIGELSLNQWQNKAKPQLLLKDYQINSLQLFDARMQNLNNADYVINEAEFIYFNEENYNFLTKIYAKELKHIDQLDLTKEQFILLDQPKSIIELQTVLQQLKDKQVVLILAEPSLITEVPTREQFIRLFNFIKQQPNFNIRKQINQVAVYLQIAPKLLVLMLQIFAELKFINIQDGIWQLQSQIENHNLEDSLLLQKHTKQVEKHRYLLTLSLQEFFNLALEDKINEKS